MAVFTIATINSNCTVECKISPLFEMMACLRSCYLNKGDNDEDLKTFYKKNYKTLSKFYGNFEYGAQLAECILGMKEDHTFPNFIKHLNNLEKEEFLYYLLGRYIEAFEIKNILENSNSPREEIKNRIEQLNGIINEEQLEFIESFNSYYNELIQLWTDFYENLFKRKELDLEDKWEQSNNSLDVDLLSNGFDKVVSKLLTGYEIPEQFPTRETKLIRFYPSLYVSPKFIVIWGLGELNIVYDASIYLSKEINNELIKQKLEEEKSLESLSEIGKSLSELGRLKILSLISSNSKIKSQEIANELNITTATVSRHLSLLKQNNLVIERKENGFNIYTINQTEFDNYFNNIKKYFFN
ncbi:ArsR/SmtB family transcription factor [Cytobacillus firmus]|nr:MULTISPECIES: ArsR family transcriptional regulator [Bacillaceae]MBG9541659.1 hypothetical protein [Cytobacillus firmus]MBG9554921.1 hypothetical protein [Cytobacillus firmus]MBG9559331.1 hypothetical protein [Cytobacillus firmus]MBG9574759.1 hypothetical protein [Cytobacillus firmus]MEC1892415.1 ArsR family transcriptional regulator [Cytobacillus firmus]